MLLPNFQVFVQYIILNWAKIFCLIKKLSRKIIHFINKVHNKINVGAEKYKYIIEFCI